MGHIRITLGTDIGISLIVFIWMKFLQKFEEIGCGIRSPFQVWGFSRQVKWYQWQNFWQEQPTATQLKSSTRLTDSSQWKQGAAEGAWSFWWGAAKSCSFLEAAVKRVRAIIDRKVREEMVKKPVEFLTEGVTISHVIVTTYAQGGAIQAALLGSDSLKQTRTLKWSGSQMKEH